MVGNWQPLKTHFKFVHIVSGKWSHDAWKIILTRWACLPSRLVWVLVIKCEYCTFWCLQTNTFQAVLVTDGTNSFAIFIYLCGDLDWTGGPGGATIGYTASTEMFKNHRLSGSPFINSIACLNNPHNQFFTVVYALTDFVEGTKYTL